MRSAPGGVELRKTADGFCLRAKCGTFVDTVMRVGLGAGVSALPFILWWDLIRGVWTDTGFSFWMTLAFLTAWFSAALYADAIALVSLAGEVRVTRTGDEGTIFTGIGKVGIMRRFQWSEVSGVVMINGSRNIRYLVLAADRGYRVGWQLSYERQDFMLEALRAASQRS